MDIFHRNTLHLTLTSLFRAYLPVQGTGRKLTTTEHVVNALTVTALDVKYRGKGTTLAGLQKEMSESSEDGEVPAKHLVKTALEKLEVGRWVSQSVGGTASPVSIVFSIDHLVPSFSFFFLLACPGRWALGKVGNWRRNEAKAKRRGGVRLEEAQGRGSARRQGPGGQEQKQTQGPVKVLAV